MAAPNLAQDEAGNIWIVDANGKPIGRADAHGNPLPANGAPNVVVPAAPKPKDLRSVPGHPELVFDPETGKVIPLPGVPNTPTTKFTPLPKTDPRYRPEYPGAQINLATGEVNYGPKSENTSDNAAKKQTAIEATRNLVQSIEKAKGLVSGWSTGFGGYLGQSLPAGTQANKLDTIINQEIRGNIFKNWVDTMKAQTDTGTTGIGRIMQSEIPLVTGSLGALDPVKMGEQGTLDSLNQIEQRVLRSAAMLNGENPDDQKVLHKYHQQFIAPTPGDNTPKGPGYAPPPTGSTGNIGPSTNGFSETPDPQSAGFWEDAIRQQVPYRTALQQWQSDVKARGLIGQVPPDVGLYHQAQAYVRQHPDVPYNPVDSVTRKPIDPLSQAATDAAFSGPGVLAGHYANQLAGGIPTALAGEQGDRYNAVSSALHPGQAEAGDVTGLLTGALATNRLLKPAFGLVSRGANPMADYLNAAKLAPELRAPIAAGRQAMLSDMAFGTASGAANNPAHPLLGAIEGGGSMAAGNVAGRYLLGPVLRAGAKGFNRAAGMFGAASDIPQALSPSQNMIFSRANSGLDSIRGNLQDAASFDLPYSLADADPRLRALAGSAARKSPNVRAIAENVFGPRQQGQAERAIAQIDSNLAPVGDVPSIMADARTRAQAASKPLYQAAEVHPEPNDPKLREMLDTPAGQQAIRNGYNIALNSGESPGTLSLTIGENGNPILNGLPNWKTLQYAKMGLDQVIADNTDSLGKLDLKNPANRALNELRARFVNRLGELNPDYRAANAAYEKLISQGTAAQRGAAATAARVTPEQAQAAAAAAGDNLPHFQQGYASDMADQVERSRLSGNPYNMIYGSLGQRAKVAGIFPQGAPAFDRVNALEGDMGKTGTELFGGSQTQPRAEADKMFGHPGAGVAGDIAFGLATGVPPPSLLRAGARAFAGDTLRMGIGKRAMQKADQLAPLLLNTDPQAALALLDELTKTSLARRSYVNQMGTYGGMFGAPLLSAPVIYGANR